MKLNRNTEILKINMPNHRYLNEAKEMSLKPDSRPRNPQPPQYPVQCSKWLGWAIAAFWEPATKQVPVINQIHFGSLSQTPFLNIPNSVSLRINHILKNQMMDNINQQLHSLVDLGNLRRVGCTHFLFLKIR